MSFLSWVGKVIGSSWSTLIRWNKKWPSTGLLLLSLLLSEGEIFLRILDRKDNQQWSQKNRTACVREDTEKQETLMESWNTWVTMGHWSRLMDDRRKNLGRNPGDQKGKHIENYSYRWPEDWNSTGKLQQQQQLRKGSNDVCQHWPSVLLMAWGMNQSQGEIVNVVWPHSSFS